MLQAHRGLLYKVSRVFGRSAAERADLTLLYESIERFDELDRALLLLYLDGLSHQEINTWNSTTFKRAGGRKTAASTRYCESPNGCNCAGPTRETHDVRAGDPASAGVLNAVTGSRSSAAHGTSIRLTHDRFNFGRCILELPSGTLELISHSLAQRRDAWLKALHFSQHFMD
jgi:hypothetical protein